LKGEWYNKKKGGIKMSSCMRCGEKLSHNYLVTMFTTINEKRKRVMVCSKCKEIFNKKEDQEKTAPSKEAV
jgi:hypothetical protein